MINKNNAEYFLFLNAAMWGSTYIVSKMLLDYLPPFWILFINALGGLIITAIISRRGTSRIGLATVLFGMAVSFLTVIGSTFFIFALQYTSGSNTAFIVQISILITPILMALAEKRLPERRIIISALAALLGVFLITFDLKSFRFALGDLLALGNAVFFSLSLVGQKYIMQKIKPTQFTLIFYMTNAVAFLALALIFKGQSINFGYMGDPGQLWLIFLIIVNICIAVFTILIQSTAVKYVKPEKICIIYTIEPVVALLLGFIFIGEKLDGIKAIIGCIIILIAVVYSVLGQTESRIIEAKERNLTS